MTAKEWKENNPNSTKGNIRDYADLIHLVILTNLENINAELIRMKISQRDRLVRLNSIAKKQMQLLKSSKTFDNLKYLETKMDNNKNELNYESR